MDLNKKDSISASWSSDPMIYIALSAFRSLIERSRYGDYSIQNPDNNEINYDARENKKNLHSPHIKNFLDDYEKKEMSKITATKDFKEKGKHQYEHLGEKIDIEYKFNNIGFRGPDVTGDEDFIAIGCSQTFGYSLPEEFTWPAQLAKLNNSNVVNLGFNGDSAKGAILKAIAYIEQFGKPKAVFACFPLRRSEHFSVPEVTFYKSNPEVAAPFNSMILKNNKKVISKAPHDFNEVNSVEDQVFDTYCMINIFDKYCKEAGIKFIWTGWESMFESSRVQSVINNHTSGFFFMNDMSDMNYDKNISCHTEYLDHPLFHYAADATISKDNPKDVNGHKGIHWNIHMAEKCHSEYLKSIAIDNLSDK